MNRLLNPVEWEMEKRAKEQRALDVTWQCVLDMAARFKDLTSMTPTEYDLYLITDDGPVKVD